MLGGGGGEYFMLVVLIGGDWDQNLSVLLLRSRSAFLLRSRSALLLCSRSGYLHLGFQGLSQPAETAAMSLAQLKSPGTWVEEIQNKASHYQLGLS